MDDEKRFGRQEPTVRFTLPYQKTLCEEAITLYEKTGRTCLDWQKGLLADMLAVTDDGFFIHSRFGYSVPRQNGKNEVIAIRELWGLQKGEMILHTAHRTSTSGAAWMRLVTLLEASGIKEKKGEIKSGYRSGKSKGQEFIELDDEFGGGRINFRTRTTTGGLGETYDLLVIDEAQEYQDDQESALKYTIVSRPNPQTIYLGTPPTPYSSGTLFVKFRKDTLCGTRKHAGWAEWSVPEQSDINNIDLWYETNPSMGYTLTERNVEDELGDDEIDFNIQRLGLWIKYNQKSEISKQEWKNLEIDVLPKLVGQISIGIKFGVDDKNVAMAIAVNTDEDKIFTEVIACRSMRDGIEWITNFLSSAEYSKAIVDGKHGIEILSNKLKNEKISKPVVCTTGEYIEANALFEQNLYKKRIVHMNQPSVENVVSNCEKRAIGTGGGFGYKSISPLADIAIMDAMILAMYGCEKYGNKRKQRISY